MTTLIENKLYCVEVPSNTVIEKIEEPIRMVARTPEGGKIFDFKILGEVTKYEISFDVEDVVECYDKKEDLFYCFEQNKPYYLSKNNSFRSLLQSKGVDLNKENVKLIILEKL